MSINKRKSLRAIARELGYSAQFISEVSRGRVNGSDRVLNALRANGYEIGITDKTDPRAMLTSELVNAFLLSCQSRGLSRETIRWYNGLLGKFGKMYQKLPRDPGPVETFIGTHNSSGERRHGSYRAIRTFYNWLETRYEISSPVKKISPPPRPPTEKRALTQAELKKLLEYPDHEPFIREALYLLVDTGARVGEIADLDSDHVFEDSIMVKGKTSKSREVPISKVVKEMLDKLGPGKLFPYTVYRLRRKVSWAFSAAGVLGTAHILRHTMATNWRGSDLALKQIGGWRSWAMVEHYSHRRMDKAKEEHKKYSPLATMIDSNGDNGNGKKGAPRTPALPIDAVALFLEKYPAGDVRRVISIAEYTFEAMMYHQSKVFLRLFRQFQKQGTITSFHLRTLCERVVYGKYDDKLPDRGAVYQDVKAEASKVWEIVAALTSAYVEKHRASAMMYKELSGMKVSVEKVKLDEKVTLLGGKN